MFTIKNIRFTYCTSVIILSLFIVEKGEHQVKPLKADLLMLIATMCLASAYLFIKMGLGSLEVFNLNGLRFGIAFVIAGAIFYRKLRHINIKTLLFAMLQGFLLFAVVSSIAYGLKTTSTSNASFLVSLTVVFVPIISSVIFRQKMKPKMIYSILLAILGIGFLTIKFPFHFAMGDLFCIAAAVSYAFHIIVVGYSSKQSDPLCLGVLQLGFAALFSFICSFLFETPALPTTMQSWIAILSLGILCSATGFILQTIAQKYTTPTRIGLIFSLEPVFAAILGYFFANEIMSMTGYIGAALVLLSVFISSDMKLTHLSMLRSKLTNMPYPFLSNNKG